MNATWRVLALGASALGCTDPIDAGTTVDSGPPVVLEHSIVLDTAAQVGRQRIVARDPDGPAHIECWEAFPGEADDSLTVTRPFSELRFDQSPYISSGCAVDQAGSFTYSNDIVPYEYAIDRPPIVESSGPSGALQAGVPSAWPVRFEDDWFLDRYWIEIAPGSWATTCGPWSQVGMWAAADRSTLDTTISITFGSSGSYCVVIGTGDDNSHNVAIAREVLVGP